MRLVFEKILPRLGSVIPFVGVSLCAAWPVWGHEGEPISTTLWTAVGLGAVMIMAYGVSWGAVRPLMRRGDEAMRAARAQRENAVMRRLLDSTTDPVALLDPEGRVDLLNVAWRTEVDPRAVNGRPLEYGGAKIWQRALEELAGGAAVSLVRVGQRQWQVEAAEGAGYCVRPLSEPALLRSGPISIDLIRSEARCGCRRLDLTGTEFRLLASLVERGGETVGRDELLREVWGHQGPVRSRTVDTHIRRLRDKLGPERSCITTVRGQGYCIDPGK